VEKVGMGGSGSLAKASYLQQFVIDFTWPHVNFNPGEAGGLSRGETIKIICNKMRSFETLTATISRNLQERQQSLTPDAMIAVARLTQFPLNSPYLLANPLKEGRPYLYFDYPLDPMELIDLPDDPKTMRTLAMEIANDYCGSVSKYSSFIANFPLETFERSIEEFRTTGHVLQWKTAKKIIEGTQVTAEFIAHASTCDTIILMILNKRNKELFRTEIHARPNADLNQAKNYEAVHVEQDGLRIRQALSDDSSPSTFVPAALLPQYVCEELGIDLSKVGAKPIGKFIPPQ
jgi:hypothetical protein